MLGIGKRAEMPSHTVLDQVPDVLRSLVNIRDVSLDQSRVTTLPLFLAGSCLVKANFEYNAIADVDSELPAHG